MIYSITPFTLLDYPNKVACIIWIAGCNLRCKYCYNPQIVYGKNRMPWKQASGFLNSRVNKLQGVVFLGGEPTTHPDLFSMIKDTKDKGFLVKLDTNGLRPDVLEKLIGHKLLDMVALDYKSTPNKFREITGANKYEKFEKSLKLLIDSGVNLSIRTTVHPDLLNINDVKYIEQHIQSLGYNKDLVIQKAITNVPMLGFGND